MTPSKRRLVLGLVLVGAFAGFFFAFRTALVPATHADHDHGILNLDAGGYLEVETRGGKTRNLVGAPGKVLVVHFVDPVGDAGAADDLRSLFAFQEGARGAADAEVLVLVKTPSFASLDAWLTQKGLVPPVPASLVVDADGVTTKKFNAKHPLETMFFGPDGKLASQSRGRLDWALEARGRIAAAASGETIE